MFRRAPRYTVTTFALVIIAVAAFGLKMASRYLPERRANQLAGQYGEYVVRSDRQNIDWFPFGTAAFDEAERTGKVIVLDVGTTVSLAAKAFSEDYATDEEYRRLLHDHFVAVKVDALEIPWLVEALGLEAESFASYGRFLLAAMDSEGAVLDYSELKPRSGDLSLAVWLEAIARLRYTDQAELRSRADASLRNRRSAAIAKLDQGAAEFDEIDTWSIPYERAALQGELGRSNLPVGTLVMQILLASPRSEVWGSGLSLMLGMAESPCYDAIDGGFFIMAWDPGWQRPVTSKMPGHSLQVAATYAEIAARFDLPLFRWIAIQTAEWAVGIRVNGIFPAADSTDQINGRSAKYALGASDIERTQFEIDADGLPSIVPETSFAAGVSAQRTASLSAAAEKLRKIRSENPKSRIDPKTYANLNGQAISGLFRIGKALGDRGSIEAASSAYTHALETFVMPLGDVRHAPEGIGKSNGFAGDYAWMVRAALDGYFATGDAAMLENAKQIAGRMLELFRGEEGAIASYLPSLLSEFGFGFPIYNSSDTELPSINALASMNFSDLAAITGSNVYRDAAADIIRAFSGAFLDEPAPLGLILAGKRLYAPVVLANGVNAPRLGVVRTAKAPPNRFSRPGLYLAASQRVEGPLTEAQVRARLSIP